MEVEVPLLGYYAQADDFSKLLDHEAPMELGDTPPQSVNIKIEGEPNPNKHLHPRSPPQVEPISNKRPCFRDISKPDGPVMLEILESDDEEDTPITPAEDAEEKIDEEEECPPVSEEVWQNIVTASSFDLQPLPEGLLASTEELYAPPQPKIAEEQQPFTLPPEFYCNPDNNALNAPILIEEPSVSQGQVDLRYMKEELERRGFRFLDFFREWTDLNSQLPDPFSDETEQIKFTDGVNRTFTTQFVKFRESPECTYDPKDPPMVATKKSDIRSGRYIQNNPLCIADEHFGLICMPLRGNDGKLITLPYDPTSILATYTKSNSVGLNAFLRHPNNQNPHKNDKNVAKCGKRGERIYGKKLFYPDTFLIATEPDGSQLM